MDANASLSWDITRGCNLSCAHCSNADDRAEAGKDLPLDRAAQALAEFASLGGSTLQILGGEPFLRKDILTSIRVARQLGLRVTLTTNGVLRPDDDACEWLMAELSSLILSLDGARPETNDPVRGGGTFRRILESIAYFAEVRDRTAGRCKLCVSSVIHDGSVQEIPALIDLVESAGADTMSLTYLKRWGAALQQPEAVRSCDIETLFGALVDAARHAETKELDVVLFEVPKRIQVWMRSEGLGRVAFGGDPYCDAAQGQLRLSSDGILFPCFAGSKVIANAGKDALSVADHTVPTILGSDAFDEFEASAHSLLAQTTHRPCRECAHFKAKDCYPGCPYERESLKPALCRHFLAEIQGHAPL